MRNCYLSATILRISFNWRLIVTTEDVKDLDSGNVAPASDKKPNVSSNTEVILLDSNLNQLVTGNRFLGLDRITFNKKDLNHIRQLHVVNSYGQDEIYRVVLTEMNIDSVSTNIKYAAILINTSQLEQISQNHEQLIVVVMASFWILSILASLYLARVSVKPLLESMQKQKSFVEMPVMNYGLRWQFFRTVWKLFLENQRRLLWSQVRVSLLVWKKFEIWSFLTTNLLNLARRDDGIKPEFGEIEPDFFNTTFTNYEMIASENNRVLSFPKSCSSDHYHR